MGASIEQVLLSQGQERFSRGMEGLSSAERREIFHALGVPAGGPGVSARQRTARRIRIAWDHLERQPDGEVAATYARHWLARHRMDMIRALLDRLEVEHEGGFLRDENALAQVPAERMAAGLSQMVGENDPADVELYAALMGLTLPDGPA